MLAFGEEVRMTDTAENHAWRRRIRDSYYDLSRESTEQLELPFWLTPHHPGETAEQALRRLAERVPRILAGEQVFRPLYLDARECLGVDLSVNVGQETYNGKVKNVITDFLPRMGMPKTALDSDIPF